MSAQSQVPMDLVARFFWAAKPLLVMSLLLATTTCVGTASFFAWTEYATRRDAVEAHRRIRPGMTLDEVKLATAGLGDLMERPAEGRPTMQFVTSRFPAAYAFVIQVSPEGRVVRAESPKVLPTD